MVSGWGVSVIRLVIVHFLLFLALILNTFLRQGCVLDNIELKCNFTFAFLGLVAVSCVACFDVVEMDEGKWERIRIRDDIPEN